MFHLLFPERIPVPYEIKNEFFSGILTVVIFTNPPEKSAGNSGAGDLTMIIFSIIDAGITSKENALASASELGVAVLFSHTALYLCARPRQQ